MTRFISFLLSVVLWSVVLWSSAAHAIDAFPDARETDWTSVGVPGGRPNVTGVYTNRTTTFTAAMLNGWLDDCPSNQVILLPAGTFDMGGTTINFNGDGVVCRGQTNAQGAPTTILENCYVKMPQTPWPSANNWTNITTRTITSGLSQGSTVITLSSAPDSNITVGHNVMVDQTDDGTLVKDSSLDWAHRPNRCYAEIFHVVAINGNDITVDPPVTGTYWDTGARTPQMFGWRTLYGSTLKRAGLENIQIDQGSAGNTYTLMFGSAYGSWVHNVFITGWGTSGGSAGIRPTYSAQCEITHCKLHDQGAVSSSSYGIYPIMVNGFAIEDNIFTNLALAMPIVGVTRSSISFNVGHGPYPYTPSSWLPQYFFPHGGFSHHILYEGNWLDSPIYIDAIFSGNNSDIALVRNRIRGFFDDDQDGNNIPITLETDMDQVTILANVLGENGKQSDLGDIYAIHASCANPIKTNNYNTVTDSIASGEELGANTVSNSYRFASKPAFAGDRQWPGIQPADGLTIAGNPNYFTNIAAGYRMFFGSNVPLQQASAPTNAIASGGITLSGNLSFP